MPAESYPVPQAGPASAATKAFAPVALLGAAGLLAAVLGVAMIGGSLLMSSSGGGLLSFGGGDQPASAGFRNGHPVGLYLMTRYWIATGSLETAAYYFTPDGHFYVDPQEGFSEEALARHKGEHGTVRTEGDDMIVTWANGKESRAKLERDGGGFGWDMGLFAPMEGFDSPSKLVGKWEGGHSVHFGGNTAMTSSTFDFHDDGTFTREGASSFQINSDESQATAGSTGGNAGKWKLDGFVLELTFDDGRVLRGVSFPFDDDKTPVDPDRFYFAGTMYRHL